MVIIALFLSSLPERRVWSSIFSISSFKATISFLDLFQKQVPTFFIKYTDGFFEIEELFSIVSKGRTYSQALLFP